MKQRMIKAAEKIAEIIIVLTGETIKVVLLLLALNFYLEGKRLEMWVQFIGGYICQIIFYKLFLFPYISPIKNKNSRNQNK